MEFSCISKVGNRNINEDCIDIFKTDDKTVFLLADGLGGHGCGEIASREAIAAAKKHILENHETHCEKLMEEIFQKAHETLKNLQRKLNDDSLFKTTLAVLIVGADYTIWGHIGDSRIYHFEKERLIERSMDHSVPQMLVNSGTIKEKKIRHHEDRNRLLKVLGSEKENFIPYINGMEPRNNQTNFLLCTDGFWELVEEKKMEKTLKKSDSCQQWMDKMEKEVLKNGEKIDMDNYSAIAVRI